MPTREETRLKKAVQRASAISVNAKHLLDSAIGTLNETMDQVDTVIGGAHANVTDAEIDSMLSTMDEAITNAHVAATDARSAVEKMREARGRLDRTLTAAKASRRTVEPPPLPPLRVPYHDSPAYRLADADAEAQAGQGGERD